MSRPGHLASNVVRSLVAFTLVSLSAIAVLAAARQGRGPEQLTISVDVDLVVFDVMVTDDRGRYVSGLKQSDFQVREEGRFQAITLFTADEVSASVGLIIDNSGSLGDKRAAIAEAAIAFAGASNPEDEMFVVNFNENPYLALPAGIAFTNDQSLIRGALVRITPVGLTALYDALALGLEHLKIGARDRKALVVLSDGGDNASRHSLDDVLADARLSRVTIYTTGIYDDISSDRNPGALRKIADLSGGRAYFPDSIESMEEVWRDIAGGIRNQYTIGYESSNPTRDGAFREVEINARRMDGRRLRVITRDGYFAPTAR